MNICVNKECELYNTCRRSEINNPDVVGGTYIKLDGEECYKRLEDE